nr:immunoglobulin heavy chain junction region [Macaca mulatta]MOX92629.1 immunoglobulin heavy chain junction region [Macaca mulatta]MOX93838.1 immunoglobulin heavy chain junction region [Macaca mulatta]MOX94466.1 immunoglobulin heavy chain junction region [Macaca mulatta]MOX95727.1 immunoglobulin heavy chain junction region [Macaca mulatta]
CTVRYKGFDVW